MLIEEVFAAFQPLGRKHQSQDLEFAGAFSEKASDEVEADVAAEDANPTPEDRCREGDGSLAGQDSGGDAGEVFAGEGGEGDERTDEPGRNRFHVVQSTGELATTG